MENEQLVLKYPDATIPEALENVKYRCEIHAYNSTEFPVDRDDVIRVSAFKISKQTGQLYPNKQTFYASSNPDLETILFNIVENNKMGGWVTNPAEFDWNDYYDIVLEYKDGSVKELEFHQIMNERKETAS